jgi:ketosteroid isomerase-like protein
MTDSEHQRVMGGLGDVINTHEWDRLRDFVADDAVFEYPQSGERFRGIANIRATFENYPGMGPGTSHVEEIIGGTTYALTPTYTIIGIDGSGDRGTAVIRIQYPDGSWWWAANLYEIRHGRISRSRTFFAPDFDAPDWRAPYREAP